jgi:omega-6 fatty acid desaturase (delta-12 desaturase)
MEMSSADIHQRLAPYRKSSALAAIWQLASTLILLAAAVWLMWWSLGVAYWLTLLLAIPAAGFMVRLFIFQHDCGHGSFFRSRQANRIVGSCLGVLTLTPYEDWRHDHALHHASHGDLDHRGDGDVHTLTVDEYQQRGWWKRLGYRLYRHPLVMFGVFPTLLFLVKFRTTLGTDRHLKRQRRSVWLTNFGLAIGVAALCVLVGWQAFILLYLPVLVLAATIGVWMFYVQHQFDPNYWQRHDQWDRVHACLQGSSYYRLPIVLQWFTGNIGLHHIHHLDSRIPNYRLQRCLEENRDLLDVPTLTMWSSLRCAKLKLWDEHRERMVGFDGVKVTKHLRSYRQAACPAS